MDKCKWRIAYASVIGTSHQKNDLPCQDAGYCRVVQTSDGRDILLAVASDGAGSASRSDIGSQVTVDLFFRQFEKVVRNTPLVEIDRIFVLNWIRSVNIQIAERAEQEQIDPREFACTVLAAIVGPDSAVFFQVGDGAIVVAEPGSSDYGWVFWPQHGEFVNQTNFLFQENIEEIIGYSFIDKAFESISIFTDGIERLVLDFSAQTVHAPAFHSIFKWLAQTNPCADQLESPVLSTYLNSDFINSRTDDDKTLIMATRHII